MEKSWNFVKLFVCLIASLLAISEGAFNFKSILIRAYNKGLRTTIKDMMSFNFIQFQSPIMELAPLDNAKNQLFQNMVMLHIKLKETKHAITC